MGDGKVVVGRGVIEAGGEVSSISGVEVIRVASSAAGASVMAGSAGA